MASKQTHTMRPGRRLVSAWCPTCDKQWDQKNAHGVGVRHVDATGHQVHVEITQYLVYSPEEKE